MAAEVRELTSQEFKASDGPAQLSNRFFINLGPTGVRIAFAEQFGQNNPPSFRTAVVLPFDDALELAKLLESLLAKRQENAGV